MRNIGLWILVTALAINTNAQVDKASSADSPSVPADSSQNRIQPKLTALHYGWQSVDGLSLFYREGGPVEAPTLVFLHGSPTSSIMYQAVMEQLAATGQLHVIAMDYPSYGYSDAPNHKEYPYTFDHVAETVAHFLAPETSSDTRFICRIMEHQSGFGSCRLHPIMFPRSSFKMV